MSKRYSFIDAIFLSLYSQDLYRDVVQNWKGKGFKYLLFLVFIISVTLTGISLYKLYNFAPQQQALRIVKALFDNEDDLTFEQNLNRILNIAGQVPEAQIKDGRLVTKKDKPYLIQDPYTKKAIAIIDTSGTYTSTKDVPALLLLTSRFAALKTTDNVHHKLSEDIISYQDLESATINVTLWNVVLELLSQLPVLEIKNDQLTIKEDSGNTTYPLEISSTQMERPIITIDPDNTYQSLEEAKTFLLLGKDSFSIYNIEQEDDTDPVALSYAYSDLSVELIYKGLLYVTQQGKDILFLLIPISTIPSVMFVGFASGILMVFAYSVIGLMIAKHLSISISFTEALRLCAVSITPVLTASILLPKFLSSQGLIYFLIAIGYIYYAIRAQGQGTEKNSGGASGGSTSG